MTIYTNILGIGDRHLDNLLVDTKTGQIVPIDFGICFGMSASLLGVPELIPFRLTPQMISVLEPLNMKDLLRYRMIQIFNCLKLENHMENIQTVLDIYITDPLVEWMKSPVMKKEEMQQLLKVSKLQLPGISTATTSSAVGTNISQTSVISTNSPDLSNNTNDSSNSSSLESIVVWEPHRRIQATMNKLIGVHPVKLLLQDLALNKEVDRQHSYAALTNILYDALGEPLLDKTSTRSSVSGIQSSSGDSDIIRNQDSSSMGTSKRRKKEKEDDSSSSSRQTKEKSTRNSSVILNETLSTNDQVDVLMAMATDPNITVRQWAGLNTWI